MKADKSKVLEYVRRLENYNAPLIAEMCAQEKFQLYEESFFIYHKIQQYSKAMHILVEFINDTDRSAEYASKVNVPEVWSKLGWAYLKDKNVVMAINCYIKAEDSDNYHQVINEAILSDKLVEVIPYMLMVKKTNKDSFLDSELAFAYAKTNRLNDLEFFLS
jgi:clathrin heavy chain